MQVFWKKTIIIAIAILLCGSCSSDGRESVEVVQPTPEPPVVVNPEPPENNYTDQEMIEMIQKDSEKYFWDYAESNSKLARERYHNNKPSEDANVISVGGSGFGIMNILVGIKNGHLSRVEAVSRLTTALNFLEKADRFHGAWPHWIDGNTGKVIPFSSQDDGADLVETAFLSQGLICIREFFKDSSNTTETALSIKADELWKGVEWNWFTNNENVLHWHWSPNYNFNINLEIRGYDETLITYILAASSPQYSINKQVYQQGWARNGNIKNSATQYGIPLVVNHNGISGNVGPMFWSHYSFLGLDPRGLYDEYVNYEDATTNHAKIMYQYCVNNPAGWQGYNSDSWGLTSSYSLNADGTTGYYAHQPTKDIGIIAPTAALSSMPYIPNESINVLRYLYNQNKSKYVGFAGPYDAYSVHYNWVTPRYLAIDQGTISPMVENYKTQFLWNLFMNASDIRDGLVKLGFHSSKHGF